MKRVILNLIVSLLIVLPNISLASLPMILEPLQPYEALMINADIETVHNYLGELKGDPHLFEFTLSEPKKLELVLSQRNDDIQPIPFSLIIVKNNNRGGGVSEVGRIMDDEMDWHTSYDSGLGFTLTNSKLISYELDSGVYRFEISTALNQGKYLLRVGSQPDNIGYFEKLQSISQIQNFFAVSTFRLLFSSTVLYPLGSLVILILIGLTWFNQYKRIRNV